MSYTPTGSPVQGAKGSSKSMRDEFALIQTAIADLDKVILTLDFVDVNTAGSRFVVTPFAGNIAAIYGVNAIANTTTATVITLEIGGTLVTMPALQWGATDAIDTVISSLPTAQRALALGGALEIITDGGGAAVVPASFTVLIDRT